MLINHCERPVKKTFLVIPVMGSNITSVDLSGTTLRIVAQSDNNFQVKITENGNYEVTGGFAGNILLDLQFHLNFMTSIMITNMQMNRNSDGTSNGIADYLTQNRADVIVGEYYYLQYRAETMLLLHPILSLETTVFFRQPNAIGARNIFFSAFTYEVWKWIVKMWFVLLVSAIAIIYIADENEDINNHDIIFWVFATIFHKSYYNPKKTSVQILFFFQTVFAVLLATFFSAGLVSRLSIQIAPVNSLQDLINHNFKFIIPEFSISAYFSSYNNSDGGIKIGDSTVKPTAFYSTKDSIEKVVEGNFAFCASEDTNIATDGNSKTGVAVGSVCSVISSIQATKSRQPNGFYVQKKSPYRRSFNNGLLKIRQAGLLVRYWNTHTFNTLAECRRELKIGSLNIERQLTLNDLEDAYVIFQGGVILASIMLAIEIWRKCKK